MHSSIYSLQHSMKRGVTSLGLGLLSLGITSGCTVFSRSDSASDDKGGMDMGSENTGHSDSVGSQGGGATNGGSDVNESEQEGQGTVVSPVVSGSYVFHRSATKPKVSGIHSETLNIVSAYVGYPPVALSAIPNPPSGGARVAVLGRTAVAAELATVLVNADGSTAVEVFPVARGVNDVLVDPTGRFVFAYHNVNAKLPSEAGSNQELTVLDLQSKKTTDLSVGAHPRDIVFSSDNTRAFVVTADGVSVLTLASLGSGGKQPLVPVVPRIGLHPDRIEIQIDPASGQAIARATDIQKLWVTDLGSGTQFEYALSGPATDLDVVGGKAFAMIPGEGGSSMIELALPAGDTSVLNAIAINGAYVGVAEFSDDGQTALMYTTRDSGGDSSGDEQNDERRRVTIARRGSGDWADQQRLFVEAPIREIGISPDHANAILLHKDAKSLNPKAPYAYTLIDLSAQFPIKKLQHVVAPLTSLLFTPSGDRAALTSRASGSGPSAVEIISLRSFVVESRPLASPAVQLGYVEKPKLIFVSQSHALGRVSLFNEKGEVQTVTGFELEGGVKVGQ